MKLFLATISLVALGIGVYVYADIATQPASVITTTYEKQPESAAASVATEQIVRRPTGYEPSTIVVEPGTTVTWVNDSGKFHWPVSDYYPTHKEYPEFNPKRSLAPGEEWEFTFDKIGEWGFHDRLQAEVTGVVFVEDPQAGSYDLEEGQIMREEALVE